MLPEALEAFVGPMLATAGAQFPRACGRCGRSYRDFEEFVRTTKPIGEPTLGLGAELNPIGMVSWTNCACGNTMILHCEDGAGDMHGRFLRALEAESQASSRSVKELLQVLRSDIRSRVLERS